MGAAVLLLAITGASTLIGVSHAAGSTLTVTNCANSGAGSLRQAVANAAFFDTIDFALSPACSTIDDPNGAIIIGKDLSIDGPTSALAVSGMNESQLFDVASGVIVNISNLTIEHGTASDGGASTTAAS